MNFELPLLGPILLVLAFALWKIKPLKKSRPLAFWSVIVISCLVFLFGVNEFLRRVVGGFAGSYPYAESWNIAAKEDDVIKAIQELKNDDPSLRPDRDTSFRSSYWYFVEFNYRDTKQTVHAWTRPGRNEFTTDIAFISLSDSGKPDKLRLINKDFWYWSNRQEITKFKTQIVNRIEKIVYANK